jgi:hypothetical protein
MVFGAAVFLVSVPVFFEAPLVRALPWLSLAMTALWAGVSRILSRRSHTALWGELMVGFTWTWLAGSLFWGWLRHEPLLHLPIEAIALPISLIGIRMGWAAVGQFFYLGSLLGTAITDLYFYLVDLMPHWRRLMAAEPLQVTPIFQDALQQMHTTWGLAWVVLLGMLLFCVGLLSLRCQTLQWIAFSGAILSTILVDGLFWFVATLA